MYRCLLILMCITILPVLPGCMDRCDDESLERLEITIHGEPGGSPWDIGVPLPVYEPGTSAQDWISNLTISGNADADLVATSEGVLLRMTGREVVHIESSVRQGPGISDPCYAEGYHEARWTSEHGTEDSVQILSWAGKASVEISYFAGSSYCQRTDSISGNISAGPSAGGQIVWTQLALGRDTLCT